MHIETLKVFCDLADLRSFSKAAEKHLISQSAISQQLAQLEAAHKCQLVNRKKRPIELTNAGRLLYNTAKEIADRYEQFKSEMNALKSSTVDRVDVAAIFSIGMHALPDYVKEFMLHFPKVNMHIEYFEADRIYQQILAGEIDLGLVAIPKRDRRLQVYDFQDEPLVLACSPKHPLAAANDIDIHKVQFERFISFSENIPTRIWIDNILQRYNIIVRPVMQFDNIETIKRAIEINSGLSILPRHTLDQEVSSGTLKAVDFSNERFVRPTGIIVRKDKALTKAAKYFIELLRKKGD